MKKGAQRRELAFGLPEMRPACVLVGATGPTAGSGMGFAVGSTVTSNAPWESTMKHVIAFETSAIEGAEVPIASSEVCVLFQAQDESAGDFAYRAAQRVERWGGTKGVGSFEIVFSSAEGVVSFADRVVFLHTLVSKLSGFGFESVALRFPDSLQFSSTPFELVEALQELLPEGLELKVRFNSPRKTRAPEGVSFEEETGTWARDRRPHHQNFGWATATP